MYAIDEVANDAAAFRQAVQTGTPYKPLYVKIKLVWTCNLRCGMCNHWRSRRDAPLDLSQWQQIVTELVAWGCRKIHITGGEPTLYPDLPALIEYMTNRGLRVNMTTNGTLLTKERARALCAAGLSNVNISLDSPVRQLHDRVRGVKGAWKKTVRGTTYLQRYLKKGGLRINTVVGRRNYASLAPMPDFAADLGAAFLNLIPLDDHTGEMQRLHKEQIQRYNQEIAPQLAERGLVLGVLRQEQDAYPFGVGKTAVRHSKNGLYAQGYYERRPCLAPWTHTLIDHLGRVTVCCMLRDGPTLGDLRQQSFTDIWQGAAYTALRAQAQPLFRACHRCDDFLQENRRFAAILADD